MTPVALVTGACSRDGRRLPVLAWRLLRRSVPGRRRGSSSAGAARLTHARTVGLAGEDGCEPSTAGGLLFDGLDESQLATREPGATPDRARGPRPPRDAHGREPGGFLQVVKARGSLDRASVVVARIAQRPVGELTGLPAGTPTSTSRPGVGPMGRGRRLPLHLRDCARPLGLPDDAPPRTGGWSPTGWSGVPASSRDGGRKVCGCARPTRTRSWGEGR